MSLLVTLVVQVSVGVILYIAMAWFSNLSVLAIYY